MCSDSFIHLLEQMYEISDIMDGMRCERKSQQAKHKLSHQELSLKCRHCKFICSSLASTCTGGTAREVDSTDRAAVEASIGTRIR